MPPVPVQIYKLECLGKLFHSTSWESPANVGNVDMSTEMSYTRVSAAMASAELKYRSVKFTSELVVQDYNVVRALMVQYDL